jgi:transposase
LHYFDTFALMGRVNTPVVSEQQRAALEKGLKTSTSHAFRMRCQAILLKSDGRNSKEVGKIVGLCHVSVNSWLKRYNQQGMEGLVTKPGRGRKPSIHQAEDQEAILLAIKTNRQRISLAKADWQAQRSKDSKAVGTTAFRNFLKALADDTNGFESE